MAHIVWTNAYLMVNSVELSDHVRSITLTYEAEIQDDTTMGVGSTRSHRAGLLNWTLDVEFLQDYDANEVDATLFPLVGAAAFGVKVRPVNTTVAATNPEYNGNVVIASYPIMSGSVGDMAVASVKFQSAGALDRDITP